MIGDQMSKVYVDAEKILEMIKQESASEDVVISDNICKFCEQELIIKVFGAWLINQFEMHQDTVLCWKKKTPLTCIYSIDWEETIFKLIKTYLGE